MQRLFRYSRVNPPPLLTIHSSLSLTPHPSPLTLHPSPSPLTPHPSPLILHPSPLTLHPSPVISHPSTLTPHSSPLTSHPSPLTLHPSPLTPHSSPLTPYSSLTPHPLRASSKYLMLFFAITSLAHVRSIHPLSMRPAVEPRVGELQSGFFNSRLINSQHCVLRGRSFNNLRLVGKIFLF